jgi:hypothetical protein
MTQSTKPAKELKPALHSQKVRAGARTYFFDTRKSMGRNSDLYLTVTESHQKEGTYVKNKIIVFGEENLEAIYKAIGATLKFIRAQENKLNETAVKPVASKIEKHQSEIKSDGLAGDVDEIRF